MRKIFCGNNRQRGTVLAEAVVAIFVIATAFVVLAGAELNSFKTSSRLRKDTEANFMLKDAIEAARSFRDGNGWASLSAFSTGSQNPYQLVLDQSSSPPKWNFIPGQEIIGIYTRKIVFDKVSRDPSSKDIENPYNELHYDPDTRKVTVFVTYESRTLQLSAYFTNWK